MFNNIVAALILIVSVADLTIACGCPNTVAQGGVKVCKKPDEMESMPACKIETKPEISELDKLLTDLSKSTDELKSYQAEISSAYIQPLLETQSVRRGQIIYSVSSKESKFLVRFNTRQDDDEPAQSDKQEIMFNGVWLTRVNYSTTHVEKNQLAREDKPADVLSLVSQNFPMIGFSNIDKLKELFELELIEDKTYKHVKLTPKENSKFADEYEQVDFWVDTKTMLPVRIDALTLEEDIYRLKFDNAKINKKIAPQAFNIQYPADFTVEVKPLKN